MAKVFIPIQCRDLTHGVAEVEVDGRLLRHVIAALEERFPGLAARLCVGDAIAPGLAVSIDGALSARGLLTPLAPHSEVHFLPAIGGG